MNTAADKHAEERDKVEIQSPQMHSFALSTELPI